MIVMEFPKQASNRLNALHVEKKRLRTPLEWGKLRGTGNSPAYVRIHYIMTKIQQQTRDQAVAARHGCHVHEPLDRAEFWQEWMRSGGRDIFLNDRTYPGAARVKGVRS